MVSTQTGKLLWSCTFPSPRSFSITIIPYSKAVYEQWQLNRSTEIKWVTSPYGSLSVSVYTNRRGGEEGRSAAALTRALTAAGGVFPLCNYRAWLAPEPFELCSAPWHWRLESDRQKPAVLGTSTPTPMSQHNVGGVVIKLLHCIFCALPLLSYGKVIPVQLQAQERC